MDEKSKMDRMTRFAQMHSMVRLKSGKSQDYMAREMCLSKRTIQNWEKGISSPTFFQSLEWFRILHVNPFPHYLSIVFPEELIGLKGTDNDKRIEEAFDVLIKNLSINDKRALLYLFYGQHGSSPTAIIQMMLAHLHLPMKDRVAPATIVVNMYEMEKALNNLVCPENIQPDMDVLNSAVLCGKDSAKKNESGYADID